MGWEIMPGGTLFSHVTWRCFRDHLMLTYAKLALQLIACALGCLSSPFQKDPTESQTPGSALSASAASIDHVTAASYYLATRKRLGLLELSALQIQCLFLCGVFEMYRLQPLAGWHYFNLASVNLKILIWTRRLRGGIQMDEARRLEQRLHWSCIKSEL